MWMSWGTEWRAPTATEQPWMKQSPGHLRGPLSVFRIDFLNSKPSSESRGKKKYIYIYIYIFIKDDLKSCECSSMKWLCDWGASKLLKQIYRILLVVLLFNKRESPRIFFSHRAQGSGKTCLDRMIMENSLWGIKKKSNPQRTSSKGLLVKTISYTHTHTHTHTHTIKPLQNRTRLMKSKNQAEISVVFAMNDRAHFACSEVQRPGWMDGKSHLRILHKYLLSAHSFPVEKLL